MHYIILLHGANRGGDVLEDQCPCSDSSLFCCSKVGNRYSSARGNPGRGKQSLCFKMPRSFLVKKHFNASKKPNYSELDTHTGNARGKSARKLEVGLQFGVTIVLEVNLPACLYQSVCVHFSILFRPPGQCFLFVLFTTCQHQPFETAAFFAYLLKLHLNKRSLET